MAGPLAMTLAAVLVLAAFFLILATPTRAGMIDESRLEPWEACALCHNLDGVSRMARFPKLAAQPADYIAKQLRDFRAGRRDNGGGQMQAMAGELDDARRAAVAGYFSALPPPRPGPKLQGKPAAAARQLLATGDSRRGLPGCHTCHGRDAADVRGAPRLEAQHPDYLTKQLDDFKTGRRRNDPDGVMRAVASLLTDDEVRILAAYLGGLERE